MDPPIVECTFLLAQDIDQSIVKYIFKAGAKWRMDIIKTIFLAFGRAKYDGFIKLCQTEFFELAYSDASVPPGDIVALLKRLTHNLEFFPCYRAFRAPTTLPRSLAFKRCNAKHRVLIYYLSVYHGYVAICTLCESSEKHGYKYGDYWDKRGGQNPASYVELKKHRIHNLKYYDLVKRGNNFWNHQYVPKDDISLYKLGITVERKDIECINIL